MIKCENSTKGHFLFWNISIVLNCSWKIIFWEKYSKCSPRERNKLDIPNINQVKVPHKANLCLVHLNQNTFLRVCTNETTLWAEIQYELCLHTSRLQNTFAWLTKANRCLVNAYILPNTALSFLYIYHKSKLTRESLILTGYIMSYSSTIQWLTCSILVCDRDNK